MKEIGTFKIDKNMCSNCREDERCPQKYSVNGNCLHIEKGLVIEQVPETFDELKELCQNIKGVEYAGGNAKGEIIQLDNIWFAENGDIWGYSENWEEVCVIGKNKTPQQMWAIIKNL